MMKKPYFDQGGSGFPLHFIHANGYPPGCYEPLLKLWSDQYHTFGMFLRPLWPDSIPTEIKDWKPLSNDFLEFLDEQHLDRVIGVGHSIGAIVSLRSALQQPDRFAALILIEPVLFPYYFMVEWNLVRTFGLGYRIHPNIQGALKRRRSFDDLDQVFIGYRRRSIFRYLSDENLRILIQGMTKAHTLSDGEQSASKTYDLIYSPEWEAQLYYTALWNDWDIWKGISRLNIPTLILRGSETDTFWASAAGMIKKKNSKINISTLDRSTHLLPIEKPEQVFEYTRSFLRDIVL
jgi:pimeloyl-ACP methyl ester carboxylesterase